VELGSFLRQMCAVILWTLVSAVITAAIGGLVGGAIVVNAGGSRAEAIARGSEFARYFFYAVVPIVHWWRIYRTMWLGCPGRSARPSLKEEPHFVGQTLRREPTF
jgi:F0F1-type ATP synthase membrane subunit c/vacuolar-type H+-ATPase subunit K